MMRRPGPSAAVVAVVVVVAIFVVLVGLVAAVRSRDRGGTRDRFSEPKGEGEGEGEGEVIVYRGSTTLYKSVEVRARGGVRSLWIDGERQVRSGDRASNEVFIHFAVQYTARRDGAMDKVLIIGDASGDSLREVMKYHEVLTRVVVVQDDEQLALLSEEHLGAYRHAADADGHNVVEYMYGSDIVATITKRLMTERDMNSFDLVIVDVETAVGPAARAARQPALYRELRTLLTDQGVLARAGDGEDGRALLSPLFVNTLVYNNVATPETSADLSNTHVLASRAPLPPAARGSVSRKWAARALPVRFYHPDKHRAFSSTAPARAVADDDDSADDEDGTPGRPSAPLSYKAFQTVFAKST
jgi:spermidine synthase